MKRYRTFQNLIIFMLLYFHSLISNYYQSYYCPRHYNISLNNNGYITSVLPTCNFSDGLTADTSLILVNAAHFKDNWRHPFNLFESDFHINKTEKVKTKMMKHTNWYPFKSSVSLDAKVVRIPFEVIL